MAKILRSRGFSCGSLGRVLKRGDVSHFDTPGYEFKGTPVDCSMRFDRVLMMHDAENGRPYLQFVEGHIKSATIDISGIPELDADVMELYLEEGSRPEVNMRWDLSNQELQNLVHKGIFGFDYDFDHEDNANPKPLHRGPVPIPEIFTSTDIQLTVGCDLRVLAVPNKEGDGPDVIPIVGIYPCDPFQMRTNSRISGYEDVSRYFREPEFLNAGEYQDDKEMQAGDGLYIREEDLLFSRQADAPEPAKMLKQESMKHISVTPVHMMTEKERRIADLVKQTEERVSAREAARAERLAEQSGSAKKTEDAPKSAEVHPLADVGKEKPSGMTGAEKVAMENDMISYQESDEMEYD